MHMTNIIAENTLSIRRVATYLVVRSEHIMEKHPTWKQNLIARHLLHFNIYTSPLALTNRLLTVIEQHALAIRDADLIVEAAKLRAEFNSSKMNPVGVELL